ncbi:MAG: hypothetical protein A3F68_02930 [Acidobacteria bacterium RIFCSPLOWO2_12_FULL_54_10]|nr:MAG: hypothetical protein A3F68_02930 [Acidobacteria bacterium RIFCSPLOWO2_12_FULL_54_10]
MTAYVGTNSTNEGTDQGFPGDREIIRYLDNLNHSNLVEFLERTAVGSLASAQKQIKRYNQQLTSNRAGD